MQSENITYSSIEISDITAWDKNQQKLLVSKIRARDIKEDLALKVKDVLIFERDHNQKIVPYAMTATPQEIEFFQWDGEELQSLYHFSTSEITQAYDSEYDNKKRIFESYLEALIEAWLRDLAYNWKTEDPPKVKELREIKFVQKLSDATREE